jgi:hypothetical protein
MVRNMEIVQEPTEMVISINSCSECGSEIEVKTKAESCLTFGDARPAISQKSTPPDIADITAKDPIAYALLKLCDIINGTWNDILASTQSISTLRELALYIDCNIIAIWKHRNKRK